MLQLNDPRFDPIIAQYSADMEALAGRAFGGELEEREYRDEVERLTMAVLLALFLLAGGNQDSQQGQRFMQEQGRIVKDSSRALAKDLYDGRYSESEEQTAEEARQKLSNRFDLWTFMPGRVFHYGLILAVTTGGTADARYRWDMDPSKKNCDDCKGLNGIVLTGAEWNDLGLYPQSYALICKGWCGCKLTPTDAPSMGLENVRV